MVLAGRTKLRVSKNFFRGISLGISPWGHLCISLWGYLFEDVKLVGYLFVFVEYLCNRSPRIKTKNIKNYSLILAVVNNRNWLDDSPPLHLTFHTRWLRQNIWQVSGTHLWSLQPWTSTTQLLLEKRSTGRESLATLCLIWLAWDLNLRPPAPETNALLLDQSIMALLNEKLDKNLRWNSLSPKVTGNSLFLKVISKKSLQLIR